MITAAQCLKQYGEPVKENNLKRWAVPKKYAVIAALPAAIYCNKDLIDPLSKALDNIIERGLVEEIETWNGCFNIRKKINSLSQSLHSWAIAIDINAATNGYGKKPTMSKELVACFTDAGFDWGGTWAKPDGMHFQLKEFPT
jgi:hypothetical protein